MLDPFSIVPHGRDAPQSDALPRLDTGYGADVNSVPSGVALPVGATLDTERYVIQDVLGRGGFGLTYCCRDTQEQCLVAIKEFLPPGCLREEQQVLPPPLVSSHQFGAARDRFTQEIVALSRLHHPNIVRARDVFQENGTAYLVMDFVQGQSIKSYVETHGPLGERETLRLAEQIGSALALAHGQQILHRDVNPDNILLTEQGDAVLIDFGAAGHIGDENSYSTVRLTAAIQFGTPGYAPIEQYGRQGKRGPYTDVYGLAATIYFILSGRTPPAASDRILGVKLESLDAIHHVTPSVATAIELGLTISSEERPSTIQEFIAALQGKKLPPSGTLNSAQATSPNQKTASVIPASATPVSSRANKRKTPFWLVLAPGVTLFLAIAAQLFLASDNPIKEVTNEITPGPPPSLTPLPSGEAKPSGEGESSPIPSPLLNSNRPAEPVSARTRDTDLAPTAPRQQITLRHWDGGWIHAHAFSPDARIVASGQSQGVVRVWDTQSGDVKQLLQGKNGWGYHVAFSPNGQWLAVAGSRPSYTTDTRADFVKPYGSVTVWEWQTGKRMWQYDFKRGVDNVAFSPNGKMLAAAQGEDIIWVWHSNNGRRIHATGMEAMPIGHGVSTAMLRFSPDSQQLATCHGDRTVRLRNALTGGNEQILQGHQDYVQAIAYAPNGQRLVSAGGNILLWSPKQGTRTSLMATMDAASFVTFSPNGNRLVQVFGADDEEKQVYIRDSQNDRLKQRLFLAPEDSSHMAFAPDNRSIYGLNTTRGVLHVWTTQ